MIEGNVLTIEKQESANSIYKNFCPQEYLAEYYSAVGSENSFLLQFYRDIYREIPTGGTLLEFGGGPTIYQLLSASRKVKNIVFAEYLAQNRLEMMKWLNRDPRAFDWTPFMDFALLLEEGTTGPAHREALRHTVQSKVTSIIECDAYLPVVLNKSPLGTFDIVSSGFCLECIEGSGKHFGEFVDKIVALVKPGGRFILTTLKNARSYRVGEDLFPSFPVNEQLLREMLEARGFEIRTLRSTPAEDQQGYEGLIAIEAVKIRS